MKLGVTHLDGSHPGEWSEDCRYLMFRQPTLKSSLNPLGSQDAISKTRKNKQTNQNKDKRAGIQHHDTTNDTTMTRAMTLVQ